MRKKLEKFVFPESTDDLSSIKVKPDDDIGTASELDEIINDFKSEPDSVGSINLKPFSDHPGTGTEHPDNIQNDTGQLVVIYIKARPNRIFTGNDIFKAVEAAGLKPGSMNIFHHYLDEGDNTGRALFSLANMLEPGAFVLDIPGNNSTPGLVMFMQLPLSIEPSLVFDLMCHTAEKISADLDGELFGPEQEILDSKAMLRIREKLLL